ncbi:response regulator [Pacificimonas flava]|uniref:Response regulatory domain-containing protein n=1 Tax=Pacificimonas flava TaxID=1234595 RepID=M2U7W3_9SPHN|nr:response regulator [Pacificimonas flava]EMD84077.1 hypothetical protein C725_0007 [Pacificimonas flava]MBB5280045.1 CheY-like chemotaxis protein [Pacificimonas flava]
MSDTERIKSLLQGKNILVAEDQVIPAMGLEVKLRYSGVHSIRICDRMAACMSVIDGDFFEPDAAIIDIDMAGKDGRELARELQARGIPFIFHTGSTDADQIASEFGGAQVVQKPSTEAEILKAVAALFETQDRDEAGDASENGDADGNGDAEEGGSANSAGAR